MKQSIVLGMLGLALAGCAQSRSSMSSRRPVGMEPVPPIEETINRGTGGPAVQQATLPDAKDPRWAGVWQGPRGGQPAAAPGGPLVARRDSTQAPADQPDGRAPSPSMAPAPAALPANLPVAGTAAAAATPAADTPATMPAASPVSHAADHAQDAHPQVTLRSAFPPAPPVSHRLRQPK